MKLSMSASEHVEPYYFLSEFEQRQRRLKGNSMKKFKILSLVVSVFLIPQILGHPGPERHPTESELQALESSLVENIAELASQINEIKDTIEAGLTNVDDRVETVVQETLNDYVDEMVNENLANLTKPIDELKEQLEGVLVSESRQNVGLLLAAIPGLIGSGVGAIVGLRLRKLKNSLLNDNNSGLKRKDYSSKPTENKQEDVNEDKEEITKTRIVTETRKGQKRGQIIELRNPDEDWSPRLLQDAIDDIVNHGITYISQGPKGNEAKILVQTREGKPYLTTEPDSHDSNNLSNLPDPS